MRNIAANGDDWSFVSPTETSLNISTSNDSTSNIDDATETEEQAALKLSVTPGRNVIGFSSDLTTTRGCVNIVAKEIPDDDESKRASVDIVIALDVSGSMLGSKLELSKRTLVMLLRELTSKDRFGLIKYSSNASVVFPAVNMTKENKEKALVAIKRLKPTGCTNLSGGLALAAQEIRMIQNPNSVRCIFLLTDGHANAGITDTPGIVKMVKSFCGSSVEIPIRDLHLGGRDDKVQDHDDDDDFSTIGSFSGTNGAAQELPTESITLISPIAVHCFGYGSDHDSFMLKEIANATSGGTYYFVENDSDVGSAFGDAMGGVLSVVAQSTVLTLRVPPEAQTMGVKINHVYHDEAIKRGDGLYTVTVGDFYAEESRDIVFEFTLAAKNNNNDGSNPLSFFTTKNQPIPHVIATLNYVDTIHKTDVAAGPTICAITRPTGSEVSDMNPIVEAQWLRVYAVKQMQEADEEAKSSNITAARTRIEGTLSRLQQTSSTVRANDTVMQVEADINDLLSTALVSPSAYAKDGAHKMRKKCRQLHSQRCSEATADVSNIYRSTAKSKLSKKYGTYS